MVRPIMKDVLFLGQKSETATKADLSVAQDLMDTLASHKDECVGMAANMIGVKKKIIVVNVGFFNVPMINPVILKKEGPFEAEEGCLSLVGSRKTTRYKKITVEYCDIEMKKHVQEFTDFTAQIIQHECDHLQYDAQRHFCNQWRRTCCGVAAAQIPRCVLWYPVPF